MPKQSNSKNFQKNFAAPGNSAALGYITSQMLDKEYGKCFSSLWQIFDKIF